MTEKSSWTIRDNIAHIREKISVAAANAGRNADEIRLMAVTKTVPYELVNEACDSGVNLLGENRAQELLEKYENYCKGAEIHFIGHLQSNKVRQIVDKVSMIHSVDRLSLAKEIDSRCKTLEKRMKVLIQVNIGDELSKSGVHPEQAEQLVRETALLPHIEVCGLMTIPPPVEDDKLAAQYFSQMQALQVDIRDKNIDNVSMDILSMGMSDDYELAITYGATIVRVGSALFGRRVY